MSSDEEYTNSEEENDEIAELPEIDEEERAKIAARGGKRRFSVSSESASSVKEAKTAIAAAVKKLPKTTDQIVRIETAIAGNILFKDLGQGQKNALYEAMWEETVGPGESEVIIKQGDEDADNFYIIDSGTVDIVVDGANVAQLDAGKSFGELALMYFAPRAATCKAATEVTLWVMDRMTFRSFVLGDGEEERKRRKEFLGTVDLLKPLEEEERGKVADAMVEKKFADGEEIMTQGDEGDALYFLEKGEATVIKDGEKVFQYTEVGQFFGELALMNNAPRAATVEASGEVVCLRLGRAEFERLVGSCQEVLQRQAMKYLKMAPVAAAEGPAAAPGAVFDMDDAPERASPSAAAGAAGGFGGGGDLESENARLRQENNALRAKNAELEAKIMALQAGGGVPEGIPYGGSGGGGLSTSSIAKKVEESRRARERLAALLNLEDN